MTTTPQNNETGKAGDITTVMDAEAIRKALRRIAHEIVEQNADLGRLVIAGIPTRGKILARRIVDHIEAIEGTAPSFGVVDVSMHRDDLATRPRVSVLELTELPLDLDGRPLVLVDRGHRELPIRADYVGKNIPTGPEDRVRVRFEETDSVPDSVTVVHASHP